MTDVEGLEWVTDEQRTRLAEGRWGDEWPASLHAYLEAHWSGWQYAGDEERQRWLEDFAATLALTWVTHEQQGGLDQLWELRGDWRGWLPAELDERWPDWMSADHDVLTAWLDEVIPLLVLPAEAGSWEELEAQLLHDLRHTVAGLYRQHPELADVPVEVVEGWVTEGLVGQQG